MAEWIDTSGGTLTSGDGRVAIQVPAGAWAERAQVAIQERPAPVTPVPDGVRPIAHVSLSRLDARGQEVRTAFIHPVTLTLQVRPTDLERTIAPEVRLFWYDPAAQDWAGIPSTYDPRTMVLSANLTHFSDYLAGVVDGVAILPSVDGSQTDLCHGNASVSLPLKIPPGPNGFQPKLTLSYSSGLPNGVISEDHATYERSQGSWVGFGWDLELGHIVLTGWGNWSLRAFLTLNGRSADLIPIGTDAHNNTTFRSQIEEFDWIKLINQADASGTDTPSYSLNGNPQSNRYVVDRLAAENVYSYDGTADGKLERSTLYCYDNATLWNTPIGGSGTDGSYRGRLTARRVSANVPNTNQYLDTTYEYDAIGNRTKERRWNAYGTLSQLASAFTGDVRDTTTVYDATYHTFPEQVTNAKGHTTTSTYDAGLGRLLQSKDPNNAITQYMYDGFGRVVAAWMPTEDPGQVGAATVLVAYSATRGQPYRVQIGRRKDGGGGLFARRAYAWRFYDGLGNLIQIQQDFDRSGMAIHAQDVNELSSAASAGISVNAGTSLIKASDFTTLRASVQSRWTGAGLGSVPNWSSGLIPGGPSRSTTKTPIYGSDIVDLRQWLNLYQYATNQARTTWTYAAGTVLTVNRFYDARGLLTAESVPHLLSLTVPGQFNAGDWNPGANPRTTHTYDALKRPLTRTQPDNQAVYRWSYSGGSTTTTDENGHQKTATTDALGRLVTVQENVGGGVSTTGYAYNVVDQLVQVTDAAGNQTTVTYDSLGRKTGMSDPDLGANWQYSYPVSPSSANPLWLVQTQTDAKGQQISYQYDALDRIVSKSGAGLSVGYGYDVGQYGKGRKSSMQDGAGSVSYGYDGRGRLTSLTRTITGSNSYQIQTSYDAQDRPLTITFPNGDTLAYRYGDHGMPVDLLLNGSVYLVKGATYNALLKPTAIPLGNGLQTSWKYFGIDQQASVSNRWYGLPYRIQTGSLQNQTFPTTNGYDMVGNPTASTYADHTNESLSFSYNELDQLTALSGSALEGYGNYLQGGVDIGNLLAKGTASYAYPSSGQPRPHAPTSVSTFGSYGYDARRGTLWQTGAQCC